MAADTEDEVVEEVEAVEPIGHVRVVYLGPVAPHWEVQSDYGPPEVIDQFRDRVLARLVLLPPTTPSSAGTASGSCATPSARTWRSSGSWTTARPPGPEPAAPPRRRLSSRSRPGDPPLPTCPLMARAGGASAAPELPPSGDVAETAGLKALRPWRCATRFERGPSARGGREIMGDTYTMDDAPVVKLVTGLIGELTEDETALVRTLTPADEARSATMEHLFDLVDLLSTIRYDEAMAEYVYAIAPDWDGTIEMLLLGARVTTTLDRVELERSWSAGPGAARQRQTV